MNNCSLILLLLITHFSYGQEAPHLGRLISAYNGTQLIDAQCEALIAKSEYTEFRLNWGLSQESGEIQFKTLKYKSQQAIFSTSSGVIKPLKGSRYYTAFLESDYLINIKSDHQSVLVTEYNSLGQTIVSNTKVNTPKLNAQNEARDQNNFCSTQDPKSSVLKYSPDLKENIEIPPIQVYIEVDYYTYLDFNQNVEDIEDWVTTTFAHTASIYAIHNISLELSQIFLWDTEGPYYDMWSLRATKDTFATEKQGMFNGHVACLMTTKNMGGAKANINGLCAPYEDLNFSGPYAVLSSLDKGLPDGSSFFWNTFLLGHEIGHVLGSPHTHACLWGPNNDQALDNCYGTEGGCNQGGTPTNGGTLMSYCYNTQNGINFANGLGESPSNLIKQNILSAVCINSCTEGLPCDDQNECTMYDSYDSDCNCVGQIIDINENNICDIYESCEDVIYVSEIDSSYYMAKNSIESNSVVDVSQSIIFSASSNIQLEPGFEVKIGSALDIMMIGCNKN